MNIDGKKTSASKKILVAYASGLSAAPDDWNGLIAKLKCEPELTDCAWLGLPHKTSALARETADEVARRMNSVLCAECTTNGNYDEIILIGHSVGALFLRRAYAINAGWIEGEPSESKWSSLVKRFVLMAPLNRGVDSGRAPRAKLAGRIGRILRVFGVHTLIYDLLQGSDFVTNLRLLWLRNLKNIPQSLQFPHVLGEDDKEVSRIDCIDTEQFPSSFHISVPGADHVRLHDLASTSNPERHYALLREAILGRSIESTPPDDQLRQTREDFGLERPGKSVVFLLHGIRDDRLSWASKVAEYLKGFDSGISARAISHGYVTALKFALPFFHRKVRRKLQDEYAQAVAEYPNANFHAAAHSNGTYIVAEALKHIEAMRFDRIMFGGCVLPRVFDWGLLVSRGQVRVVRHDFTRTDAVVATLCSALSGVGRRDVGTAGYNGFTSSKENLSENELPYGGHGAAFDSDDDLLSVARFLHTGEDVKRPDAKPAKKPFPGIYSRLAAFSWVAILLIAVVICVIGNAIGAIGGTLIALALLLGSLGLFLHVF